MARFNAPKDAHGRFLSSTSPLIPKATTAEIAKRQPLDMPLNVRVPVAIFRTIDVLVHEAKHKGTYWWQTQSDCVRDLLYAGIEALAEPRDDKHRFLAQHDLDRRVAHLADTRKKMETWYDQIDTEIGALNLINPEKASIQLQASMRMLGKVPPSPWRDRLLDRLKDRFPALLKVAAHERHPFDDKLGGIVPPDPDAEIEKVRMTAKEAAEEFDDPPGVEFSVAHRSKTKKKRKGKRT